MIHRPDVYLSIHSYPVEAIREQVLNGHLDLGYTVLYDMEQLQTEELDYCVINVCPHNVGMLLGNPLAKKELIEIQFRPVANTRSGVALIWRKANNKPELKEFIDKLEVNLDMWF